MKELIFTWSIENIDYSWYPTGEPIVSPIFYARPMQETAWTLVFYPRGSENSDYLSLFLYRAEDQVPIDLAINFELSCIAADTSVLHSCLIPETFVTFEHGQKSGYGEPQLMQRHEVLGRRKALYLPKDILTLRCRMWKDGGTDEFEQVSGRTRLTTERIISVGYIHLENEVDKTFHIRSKCRNEALMSIRVLSCKDKIDLEINPINEENMKFSTLKLCFVDKKTGRKLAERISSFFGDATKEKWRLPFSDKVLLTENEKLDGSVLEFKTELVYSTGEEVETIEENCPRKISKFLSNYIVSCVPSGKLSDLPTISDNLWDLYNDQVFCDLEVITPTTSFFVHKIVLCARSSLFLTMLTGEMKEKINACIEMEEIADGTLEIFLNFLYTDVFEELEWDAVMELYYAADKYQVERLKLLCCSYLLKNVDADNVCELLILADRHHDCELKRKAENFIWKNEEKVFTSSAFKKFALEQQRLAIKTVLSKFEGKENQSPAETYDDRLSSIPRIKDDFRSLFQGNIASDVVIKTEGSTIPAHKTFLCATSSTFREVFKKDLRSTDIIEMTDWEEDTVRRMLLFMCTDSFEDIQWDIGIKLYKVADAYQIHKLQMKCSCFLLENLKVSNASSLLLLAHEHRDVKLKSVVEDYICLYDEEIFGSDEWAKFSNTNLLLANETMRAKYKKN